MDVRDNVLEAIGGTPLIRLTRASEATGCEILGKAEFMNPGQSVKDRAALFIIRDAIDRGTLRPGGVVVDGTAGNTGIGLAIVANALGLRTVIVIPDTQSQEKKDTLRLLGAELVEVPAVPYANPNNYVKVSGRMAERLAATDPNGAVWANQFDNVANREAHLRTTGPEIWEQTGGKVDGFVCAVGTGGTLAGVAEALRARQPGVAIAHRRSVRRRPLFLLHDRRAAEQRQLDLRRYRPGPGHRQSRGTRASTMPSRFPTRRASGSSSTCSSMRGCASACRPASTSPARSGWRASWAPATPSSPSWLIMARAISRDCSILFS